jgi:hypothetical protein
VEEPSGGPGKLKAAWLADAVAKLDEKKKKKLTTGDTDEHRGKQKKNANKSQRNRSGGHF